MGGMRLKFIRSDEAANEPALNKVRHDKLREVKAGHDVTWVAIPGWFRMPKKSSLPTCPSPTRFQKCGRIAPACPSNF